MPRKKRCSNAAFVRALVDRHGLAHAELARLARVSLPTVRGWLRPEDNAAHRCPPDMAVELLCLKLKERCPLD